MAAPIGKARPHRFGQIEPQPLAEILPGSAPREYTWPVELTIKVPALQSPVRPGGPAAPAPVSVLLLRLGRQPWGSLPDIRDEPEPTGEHELTVIDAAGITAAESGNAVIHELRCAPPESGTFPWWTYPELVAVAARWIERKTADLAGHTLLLGTVMPPETALGLGICAGQPSRTRWPKTMWPLIYDKNTGTLVAPYLNLGTSDEGQ